MTIIYLCIFFLGASIASFLNATVYRLENGFKYPAIITQGSHCEKCGKELSWIQLIPVLGFFIYKGQCPKCKTHINAYYPISELLLGAVFLLFYIFQIPIYLYIIVLFLFVLSFYDSLNQSVPRTLVHILIGICVLIFFFFTFTVSNIYIPLGICLLLLIINIFKKSFGMGDILILASIGILQSMQLFVVTFWLSIFIALLYSLILIAVKKISIKKAKIAMVPFISIGFVVSTIYGQQIYSLLLKLMGI